MPAEVMPLGRHLTPKAEVECTLQRALVCRLAMSYLVCIGELLIVVLPGTPRLRVPQLTSEHAAVGGRWGMSRSGALGPKIHGADTPFPCVLLPGGVITYIGSSGSSPSRTSPESLYSDSSNGSFQSLSQGCPAYFPPSPTGSLTQDPARSFGSIPPNLSDDGSPSSSSSSSSSFYNGSPSGGLQVALEDSSRVSPSKSTSNITSA